MTATGTGGSPIVVVPAITGIHLRPAGHHPPTSLYQTSIRLRHECPYRELSGQFPDLTIREWHLSDCQVLEITTDDSPSGGVVEAVGDLGTILHEYRGDDGLQVVTKARLCDLENTIVERFEAHNRLYQPPTVHRHGWEQYSLIAFDEADIAALHADLEADREIEVVAKTGLEENSVPHNLLMPIGRLFGDLTDRQLAALRIALEGGYYEQPRRASVADLAAETTVARATFEEHLRKAENKLLSNVGQFTRLLAESGATEDLRREGPPTVAGET